MSLAGIASIAFGLYVLVNPGKGALAIIWLIALYELFWGVLLTLASFVIRSAQRGGGGRLRPV